MKHIIHFAVLFIVFLAMETAALYILYEYIYRYVAGDTNSGNAGGQNGSFVHLLNRIVKYYWRIFYCILKRNFFSDRKRDWKEKAGTGKK